MAGGSSKMSHLTPAFTESWAPRTKRSITSPISSSVAARGGTNIKSNRARPIHDSDLDFMGTSDAPRGGSNMKRPPTKRGDWRPEWLICISASGECSALVESLSLFPCIMLANFLDGEIDMSSRTSGTHMSRPTVRCLLDTCTLPIDTHSTSVTKPSHKETAE